MPEHQPEFDLNLPETEAQAEEVSKNGATSSEPTEIELYPPDCPHCSLGGPTCTRCAREKRETEEAKRVEESEPATEEEIAEFFKNTKAQL